jgi:hypothetical protein
VNSHETAKTAPKMRGLIVGRRQAGETSGRIAIALGVSAVTVRKWLARQAAEGEAGLADRSSRPRKLQTRTWTTADQRAGGGGAAAPPPAVLEDCSLGRPVPCHRRQNWKVLRIEPLVCI